MNEDKRNGDFGVQNMQNSANHASQEEAVYREQVLAEYRNNPLIEALPDILLRETAIQLMANYPEFREEELSLPPEHKLHCIRRLKDLVHPLPEAISLEQTISQMIRRGYLAHNPLVASTWQHRYVLANGDKPGTRTGYIKPNASCLFVNGYSGMGKTTMINSALTLYPQVIYHKNYKGEPRSECQIVWLKINCPYDGSLNGLCLEFFSAVDKILGTDYFEQYSGQKVLIDVKLKRMEIIASDYFLGILVIDELHNLNLAKAGGAKKALSFFRSLLENIGIPLIFAGTYAATELFAAGMQEPRRATDEGIIEAWRPSSNDIHWENFVNVLEKYQWIGTSRERFCPEVRKKIYDLSQGITDFAVRLVMLSQRTAIEEGRDSLTVKLLNRTSERHFRLLLPAIEALRSGDPSKMRSFDDLLPPKYKQLLDKQKEFLETPTPTSPSDGMVATSTPEKKTSGNDINPSEIVNDSPNSFDPIETSPDTLTKEMEAYNRDIKNAGKEISECEAHNVIDVVARLDDRLVAGMPVILPPSSVSKKKKF